MESPKNVSVDAWHADKLAYEEDAEAIDAFEYDRVTPMEQISKTRSRRYSRYSQDNRRSRGLDRRSPPDLDTDTSSQGYRRSWQRNSMISHSKLSAELHPPRSHSVPWSHHRLPLLEEPRDFDPTAIYRTADSDEDSADDDVDRRDLGGKNSQLDPHQQRDSDAMGSSSLRKSRGGAAPAIVQTTFVEQADSPQSAAPRKRLASSTISTRVSPPIVQVHDALRYLDQDSPVVTEESIRRSVAEASVVWGLPSALSEKAKTSPSALSASPGSSSPFSGGSGRSSDLIRDHESDRSSSPAHSANNAETEKDLRHRLRANPSRASVVLSSTAENKVQSRVRRPSHEQYGTPEMPRGKAQLPHIPAKALNPRPAGQSHAMHHLPRAEKLPLSGYELLAARVSTAAQRDHSQGRNPRARRGSIGSSVSAASSTPLTPFQNQPPLKPIYRRFEALNHRLLLQLQDELSELEEQLHRLDTADTQTRRVQNHILPASRRAGSVAGGDLQSHRTDILAKIGYKLAQYNHVLTSFTETQKLPSPTADDVDNYRTYLAVKNPIAEIEARFLDIAEDLVSLAPLRPPSPRSSLSQSQHQLFDRRQVMSDDAPTPMPSHGSYVPRSPKPWSYSQEGPRDNQASQPSVEKKAISTPAMTTGGKTNGFKILVAATAASVLVPILTFPLLPGFMARVVVVLFVALTLLRLYSGDGKSGIALPSQARDVIGGLSTRDIVLTVGAYGAVMTVIAGIV